MYRIIFIGLIISINYCLALFINKRGIHYLNEDFININNLTTSLENNIKEKKHDSFNKREESIIVCKSRSDCDFNQICYMNKCYDNINDQACIDDPKDIIMHKGNCTNPYYCERGKCKIRISYNDECSEEFGYRCYETQDDHKPKCKNKKCQIKSEEEINFITSQKGIFSVVSFSIFLIIVFFTVLHCTNTYNNKQNKKINVQPNMSINENSYPNMLNPSFERNLYLRSLKGNENKTNQDDIRKSMILNKFKTNDPYVTINIKKDFDTAGNIYPKTPQSASTLINKSFSSTNNLIDRKRTSQRSSILNSSYRLNSSVGLSSPNENSIYNISFQDFNTSNSFTYLSPSDSKNLIPQFNTVSSSTATPTTLHQSLSFSTKRLSPIESPILPLNIQNHEEAIPSSSTPYIPEVEDDDNHTTLSFDDGVIKMSNKNSSISFSNKNNKDIVEISYSTDSNDSIENIILDQNISYNNKKKDIDEIK